MRVLLTPAFVAGFGLFAVQPAPVVEKVVFLRGETLVTANADGSNVRELASDGQPKFDPEWSPDGTRIAYRTAGRRESHPQTHANIVVVDTQGTRIATVPVLATEADGTIVGGLRFVESSGWHAASKLFASGSANPYVAEYRILDLSGRVEPGYFGTGFASCAARGEVAYAGVVRDTPSRRASVEINGSPIYSAQRAGTRMTDLFWGANCGRLSFLEADDATSTLVIVRGRSVESRMLMPPGFGAVTPHRSADAFVIAGSSSALVYDVSTLSLMPGDALLRDLESRRNARMAIVQRLGGRSPNWWQP